MGKSHPREGDKSAEDRETERSCYGLITGPIPHPLRCPGRGGRGVRNETVELIMEKNGAVGRCCFYLSVFLSMVLYFNWG